MKIIITDEECFICFKLCKYLLEKTNFNILGIDNLNDYYDVSLKKKRLKYLNS